MNTLMCWSCDFETTTDENDCRVWAWIAINIEKNNLKIYGNSMESFLDWAFGIDRTLYFHNAKFDCAFIIDYLLKHEFKCMENRGLTDKQFTCLVSDKGMFYSMQMQDNGVKVKIIDSLKILPYSVDAIAKGWNLEIRKLELDYREYRAPGHELTEHEKEYITNDALIVAQALYITFSMGDTKITAASNAFHYYVNKVRHGKKDFRRVFPVPENDKFIRRAYHGGFTFVNPKFQGKIVGAGNVYDVNSLYPSVLHSPHQYPYGEPEYFSGEYEYDATFPLYFQRFSCSFEIKKNFFPTVQLKNNFGYEPTEYVYKSHDIVEFVMTSIDLKLFFDHYNVDNLKFIDGYKYKASSILFDDYIDHWYEQKRKSKEEGNMALYQLSKLKLNSFYGKMATSPVVASRYPYLKNDVVSWYCTPQEDREPIYIPVGAYVTSYARNVTIRAAQKCHDFFCYADTDSIHLLGDKIPDIEIDDYKLGAWKHESHFTKAKFLRAKLYIEENKKLEVKGAGMTKTVKERVNFDNFHMGMEYDGKLRQKTVSGGIVLVDTTFKIRP